MTTVIRSDLDTKIKLRVVQAFYDALAKGDVPAVLGLLDSQVEWTEAERFPYYSGTWVGPEAVLNNLLRRLATEWTDFCATPKEFLIEGSKVVSFGTYSGTYKKTGKSMTAEFAHLWKILIRMADLMDERADDFAIREAMDMGMPYTDFRTIIMPHCSGLFRFFAGQAMAHMDGGYRTSYEANIRILTRRAPHRDRCGCGRCRAVKARTLHRAVGAVGHKPGLRPGHGGAHRVGADSGGSKSRAPLGNGRRKHGARASILLAEMVEQIMAEHSIESATRPGANPVRRTPGSGL